MHLRLSDDARHDLHSIKEYNAADSCALSAFVDEIFSE